jgi:hypothetical protein
MLVTDQKNEIKVIFVSTCMHTHVYVCVHLYIYELFGYYFLESNLGHFLSMVMNYIICITAQFDPHEFYKQDLVTVFIGMWETVINSVL